MLLHVRAEARRTAFQLNLAEEAAFHERVQRVIDGGVRNFRHRLFNAHKDFLRRGMVAFVENHVIDVLPLRRETEAARVQPLAEFIV